MAGMKQRPEAEPIHTTVQKFCITVTWTFSVLQCTISAPPTLHDVLIAQARLGEATSLCNFFMYSIPKHILKVKHWDEPRRWSRSSKPVYELLLEHVSGHKYHVNRIQSRSHTVSLPTNVNWRSDHKVTPQEHQVSCRLKEAERKSKLVLWLDESRDRWSILLTRYCCYLRVSLLCERV